MKSEVEEEINKNLDSIINSSKYAIYFFIFMGGLITGLLLMQII